MAEVGELPKQPEPQSDKPKLLIVYGHHGINEELAKRTAERVIQALKTKTDLIPFEEPQGLDYVDAYEAASARAKPEEANFGKIYEEESLKRLREGHLLGINLARNNPDRLVVNIHATPAGTPGLPKEGMAFETGLAQKQASQLKQTLMTVLPSGSKDSLFLHLTSNSRFRKVFGDKPVDFPQNYVIIELLQDYSVYNPLLQRDEAQVSHWSKAGEIHRLKRPESQTDLGRKLALAGKINNEVAKYARLLEVVLLKAAEFYSQFFLEAENGKLGYEPREISFNSSGTKEVFTRNNRHPVDQMRGV